MSSKKDLVYNLDGVKLVIGNGFDLYCRLKTSYADYFLYDEEKNKYFLNWLNEFSPKAHDYCQIKIANHKDFWIDFAKLQYTSVWEFFFYLTSRNKEVDIKQWRWCDVESKIEESLLDYKNYTELNWTFVYRLLCGDNNNIAQSNDLYILASVVYKKNGERPFESKEEFYDFLLNELKLFEYSFGRYILSQRYYYSNEAYGIKVENSAFNNFSKIAVSELCNPQKLIAIDSFNYDSIEIPKLNYVFHNINGTYEQPIFGIDSDAFINPDPRFIFTKTSRRLEMDALSSNIDQRVDFENVVIFGHSLNVADYSYFFALFDEMKIINPECKSKIIFAFALYDRSQEDAIRKTLLKAISRLFQDYSKYHGSEHPNRLLELLMSQGKVLTFEIPFSFDDCKPRYFGK